MHTPPNTHHHLPAADERGQTLTEYALLVSVIAVVVAAALPAVAGVVQSFFSSVTGAFGS